MIFRAYIEETYVRRGVSLARAMSLVHASAGVSLSSAYAAYRGFRVTPETAELLSLWALATTGVRLDVAPLVLAPSRGRRRRRQPARRAS